MEFGILECIMVIVYAGLANSWALVAILLNNLFHPERASTNRTMACYLVNLFAFPVAMWVAIYNMSIGKFDKFVVNDHFATDFAKCKIKLTDAQTRIAALEDKVTQLCP